MLAFFLQEDESGDEEVEEKERFLTWLIPYCVNELIVLT